MYSGFFFSRNNDLLLMLYYRYFLNIKLIITAKGKSRFIKRLKYESLKWMFITKIVHTEKAENARIKSNWYIFNRNKNSWPRIRKKRKHSMFIKRRKIFKLKWQVDYNFREAMKIFQLFFFLNMSSLHNNC